MARNLIAGDSAIRAIKPGDTRKRLSDGDGLFLLLFESSGLHAWRFDYRFGGKRKLLSFGVYPDTSLALARRKADEARRLLAEGINPSDQRKAAKAALVLAEDERTREAKGLPSVSSFEAAAREWFEVRQAGWAPGYSEKIIARLENDIFPWLGRAPIAAITPPQLLEVLRRIESRGVVETAHRALDNCSQVFRYAIATGRTSTNPARDLKDALRRPQPKHLAVITDPKRFGELLRACDGYAATHVVRAALKLSPMLLLRPGELRAGEWSEIDFDSALWTVPAARMKLELSGKTEWRAAPRALASAGGGGVARPARADRARHHDLSRRTASRAADEREHGLGGVAGHGIQQRRGDCPRFSGDCADHASRATRLQPGGDRGATCPFRPGQPRPRVQPHRVHQAASGDAAEVGGLSGRVAVRGDSGRRERDRSR